LKCPYCAGEIPDGVRKCMHCAEWINKEESQPVLESQVVKNLDYSKLGVYRYRIQTPFGKETKLIRAQDQKEAESLISKSMPSDASLDKDNGINLEEKGRFTCPNCKSQYTVCNRAIGCLVMIMIFISLGIGLIMIPFLPFECFCRACGYKWKS